MDTLAFGVADVDPSKKEMYLSDGEFQECFGMSKKSWEKVRGRGFRAAAVAFTQRCWPCCGALLDICSAGLLFISVCLYDNDTYNAN